MSDLYLGLVLGYLAGTVGMLLTVFFFARLAGGAERLADRTAEAARAITANGIPAPRP